MIDLGIYLKNSTNDFTVQIGESINNNSNISFLKQGSNSSGGNETLDSFGEAKMRVQISTGILASVSEEYEEFPITITKKDNAEQGFIKVYALGGDSHPDKIIADVKLGDEEKSEVFELSGWDKFSDVTSPEISAGVLYVNCSDIGINISKEDYDMGDTINYAKDLLN